VCPRLRPVLRAGRPRRRDVAGGWLAAVVRRGLAPDRDRLRRPPGLGAAGAREREPERRPGVAGPLGTLTARAALAGRGDLARGTGLPGLARRTDVHRRSPQ
jgi:hypothetical protein